jgi:hypothetical protein
MSESRYTTRLGQVVRLIKDRDRFLGEFIGTVSAALGIIIVLRFFNDPIQYIPLAKILLCVLAFRWVRFRFVRVERMQRVQEELIRRIFWRLKVYEAEEAEQHGRISDPA